MGIKSFLKRKKTLSKRASELLEEINQSKSMQALKDSSQVLSKRASELLEEINQSKSMQALKDSSQVLSKRASELLEEINQSESVKNLKEKTELIAHSLGFPADDPVDHGIKIKESSHSENKKKNISIKKHQFIFFKPTQFRSTLYRSLTSNNKIYLWFIELLLILSVSVFFFVKSIIGINQSIAAQKTSLDYQAKVEAMKKEIEIAKQQVIPIRKENVALKLKLDSEIKRFPDLIAVQNYSDDITRLFELSNIVIVKENILYGEQYMKDLDKDPPQYSLPQADEISLNVAAAPAPGAAAPGAPAIGAPAPGAIRNKILPVPPLPPTPPRNISFITYDFMLKGNYLNYLKVRNTLTRVIPSINIPFEEILAKQDKQNIEFRVMLEIPHRVKKAE